MTAYAAPVDFFRGVRLPEASSTPYGQSPEGHRLRQIEKKSIHEFNDTAVTRLEGLSTDRNLDLRILHNDLLKVLSDHASNLTEPMHARIQRRISALLDPDEWVDEDPLPNRESFEWLIKFLSSDRSFRIPSISVNRLGQFNAAWRPERARLASLVFHQDGQVSWLIFCPSVDGDGGTDEGAGITTVRRARDYMDRLGALDWMIDVSGWRRVWRGIGLG